MPAGITSWESCPYDCTWCRSRVSGRLSPPRRVQILIICLSAGESSAREYKFHPVAILNWQPEGTLGRTEGDAECHPYIALAKNRGMVTVPMESKKPNVTPRDNRNAVKVRSFGRAKPPGTVYVALSSICALLTSIVAITARCFPCSAMTINRWPCKRNFSPR